MPMYDFNAGGSSGAASAIGDVTLAVSAPSSDWLPLDGSEYSIADYPDLPVISPLVTVVKGPTGVGSPVNGLTSKIAAWSSTSCRLVGSLSGSVLLYFSNQLTYKYSLDGGYTWVTSPTNFPVVMTTGCPLGDDILLVDTTDSLWKFDTISLTVTPLATALSPRGGALSRFGFDFIRGSILVKLGSSVNTLEFFRFNQTGDVVQQGVHTFLPSGVVLGSGGSISGIGDKLYYNTVSGGTSSFGNLFTIEAEITSGEDIKLVVNNITHKIPGPTSRDVQNYIVSTISATSMFSTSMLVRTYTKDGVLFSQDAITNTARARTLYPANRMWSRSLVTVGATGNIELSFDGISSSVYPLGVSNDIVVDDIIYDKGSNSLLYSYHYISFDVAGVNRLQMTGYSEDTFITKCLDSDSMYLSYFIKGR